jgi:hypothetical protein
VGWRWRAGASCHRDQAEANRLPHLAHVGNRF